jgi:drug/metabolite transporter (DMT)-like permease
MFGALLSFMAIAVSIRALAAKLSIIEILALRSGFGLLVLGGLMIVWNELRLHIVRRRLPLHIVRNTVHLASQGAWALALTLLPLATVFSLEFTMPAWTAVLAVLMLGERMTVSRAGAVVLGLIGVVVIVRPGIASFNPAALLVLAAALGYAITTITTKMLTETETTFAILFWMMVIQLPLSYAGSDPFFLTKLEWTDAAAVLGVGLAGLSSHYCLTNAYRYGDASLVVPLDFLRIPLIAFVGWIFYSEQLDIYVFAGAAIIVSGIVWNLHGESRRLRLRAK